ncbi:hypothetical protein [Streptomyces sp. IBSBF 3136]|uniref:hypothetical protein n=1 Tax=Streptomyces sp. IBSBF 3136 TaxID=2903524 RepID=UPI002FDC00FF
METTVERIGWIPLRRTGVVGECKPSRRVQDARECSRAFLDRLARPIRVEVADTVVLVVS